jgi:phosphate starvation-inducible PhoH-like protein
LNEKIIEITDVNPSEFFGTRNKNLTLIKKHFPKLKIVARGNKIKMFGDDNQLIEFEQKLQLLLDYFNRYNKLDENSIEQILTLNGKEKINSNTKILVHGVGGKRIQAQSINQQKMVDLMQKNDMLFAVGPAGTGKTYTAVALAV